MHVKCETDDHGVQLFVNGEPTARWRGEGIRASGELAACLGLLPALTSGDHVLEIEGGITEKLSRDLDTLQDIFCRWLPGASRVDVLAEQVTPCVGTQTMAFFSGGVDSFHAVLKHRQEIDLLVYVEGFDVAANKPSLQKHVRTSLTEAAELIGLPLCILSTDLRVWSDRHLGWPLYHGAALSAAAHLLRRDIGRAIIPSSCAYEELFPWGSHPLTDPLWSGAIQIVHSGSEVSRHEKVAAIVDEPAARKALRVCWRNPGGAYNCGRCEKCLRTMTSLSILGVLDSFQTFPDTLTASNVGRLQLHSASEMRFATTNVAMLKAQEERPDLQMAWRQAMRGGSFRRQALDRLSRGKRVLSRRLWNILRK